MVQVKVTFFDKKWILNLTLCGIFSASKMTKKVIYHIGMGGILCASALCSLVALNPHIIHCLLCINHPFCIALLSAYWLVISVYHVCYFNYT